MDQKVVEEEGEDQKNCLVDEIQAMVSLNLRKN